jgi:hypothetical protein
MTPYSKGSVSACGMVSFGLEGSAGPTLIIPILRLSLKDNLQVGDFPQSPWGR